jgi:tRNA G18 (ribose-2'-O)-methylase SpoU
VEKNTKQELSLLLLDIRSVQNVASLFRTADCAGVSKIYLYGTTPTSVDRFKRPRADFAKISLGAEKSVAHEHVSSDDVSILELLKRLRDEGYCIVALEQGAGSIDYKKYSLSGKILLILGNEVSGVSKLALAECDAMIEIPMRGEKESLNVSVAGAIAVFRLLDA